MENEKRNIKVTDDAKLSFNEYGNVSRVEMTKVFSANRGQLSTTFHYRIEKEARLSTNEETRENFPVYCKKIIEYENPMDKETLAYAHIHYAVEISKEQNIPFEYITPISEEEYKKEME